MKNQAITQAAPDEAVVAVGLMAFGLDEASNSTQFAQQRLGLSGSSELWVGAVALIGAGAVLGALYNLALPKRDVTSGLLFSLLPTLDVYLTD